ncbi:molybdenum-dependent transcriptional regulator [Syntrophotalea acetylenivorans]|uniref:Molybdenum-dependent transcriptional regulator n=1 Tax=Syntrophotalea acetylenivorans TaxID=1842532 RepID=A0A1L3GP88_9BACT|nr:TOBE domain-containing protein [Syntrophotalea acetylenivorans]APG27734.1 molybdenum-dependent transcriptional regulator [Syntrophotalea acetylenivorans]
MSEKKPSDLKVSGSLSFKMAGEDFLALNRIELLEKIDQLGSITKAGKAQGISYKTAWEQVDALNNLAEQPLVMRSAGGKGGGGTCLTEAGKEVIKRYRAIQAEHERFLAALGEHLDEGEKFYQFLRKVNMKVSARNLWTGEVVKLSQGAINTLVELKLKGDDSLTAQVTNESVESLQLALGREVFAMVKAPAIIIVKDLGQARLSSCNILKGVICRVTEGNVNSEVSLELPGGSTISATITKGQDTIPLAEGDEAWAVFQESSVILGVV